MNAEELRNLTESYYYDVYDYETIDEGYSSTGLARPYDDNEYGLPYNSRGARILQRIERLKKSGNPELAAHINTQTAGSPNEEWAKVKAAKNRREGPKRILATKAKEDAFAHMQAAGFAESHDLYDIVLEHLISEGYADSLQNAQVIMANMSDEWLGGILDEGILDRLKGGLKRIFGGKKPVSRGQQLRDRYTGQQRNYNTLPDQLYTRAKKVAPELAQNYTNASGSLRHVRSTTHNPFGQGNRAQRRLGTIPMPLGINRYEAASSNRNNPNQPPHHPSIGQHMPGIPVIRRDLALPAHQENRGVKKPLATGQRYSPITESHDLYDIVLEHLISEGYADSLQNAQVIMANMSDEWLGGILDEARILSVTSKTGQTRFKGPKYSRSEQEDIDWAEEQREAKKYRRRKKEAEERKKLKRNPYYSPPEVDDRTPRTPLERALKRSIKNLNSIPPVQRPDDGPYGVHLFNRDDGAYREVPTHWPTRKERASGR